MSVTNRFVKVFLFGLSAPLIFGASAAYAQNSCAAAMPAFSEAMQTATREALQAYLDQHSPCFSVPAQARLTALGGSPDPAPVPATPDPAPVPATPDPAPVPPAAPEPAKPVYGGATDTVIPAPVPAPVVDETCMLYANARSERWDQPVTLRVVNRGTEVLLVNWIDYEGVRQSAGSVEPGGVFGGGTFVTHPFEFTGPDGACVYILQPELGVAEYNVGG